MVGVVIVLLCLQPFADVTIMQMLDFYFYKDALFPVNSITDDTSTTRYPARARRLQLCRHVVWAPSDCITCAGNCWRSSVLTQRFVNKCFRFNSNKWKWLPPLTQMRTLLNWRKCAVCNLFYHWIAQYGKVFDQILSWFFVRDEKSRTRSRSANTLFYMQKPQQPGLLHILMLIRLLRCWLKLL